MTPVQTFSAMITTLKNIPTIALCEGSVQVTLRDTESHTNKHINPYSNCTAIYVVCTHTCNLVLQKTSAPDCGLTCFHEALSSFIITICHFLLGTWN